MMSNTEISLNELLEDYQQHKWTDFLDTSVKTGISFVPGISQFINDYVKSPSTKRLERFLVEVVKEINDLQKNIDQKIDLKSPCFQTTLMYSLQIASRNHQDEKINALKNAVLNSAFINAIDEDRQSIFLTYIDELTPSHLKTLDIITNFSQYAKNIIVPYLLEANGKASEIRQTIPILKELNKNKDFYNKIIKDLEDKTLVNFDDLRTKKEIFSLGYKVNNIRLPEVHQLDEKKLLESIKNIIKVQKELADFLDQAKFINLDYVGIINGSIYSITMMDCFYIKNEYFSGEIETKITELGKSFINFIQSPLISDS